MSEEKQQGKKRVGSLFFPLLLIAIGLIILLSNIGVLKGGFWEYLWTFWPVLLILIGLDGFFKRENLVSSTFLIGLGAIFLLSNLGYIPVDVWQMAVNLWPILFIAIGFDILVGRRTIWGSIIGSLIILAILAGAMWLFGYQAANLGSGAGQEVYEPLGDTAQADILIKPGIGTLQLETLTGSDALIEGRARSGEDVTITKNVSQDGETTTMVISASGSTIYAPFGGGGGRWIWHLGLSPEIPINLGSDMGVGDTNLELTGLQIDDLDVDMGVGQATITLPDEGRISARVDGGIGLITIVVPEGMALRVISDTGLASMSVPDGYIKGEGAYTSPGYNSADNRTDLNIELGIGSVIVRQAR